MSAKINAKRLLKPTAKSLHDWLSNQPRKTTYDYMSTTDCLLCRFVSAMKGDRVHFIAAINAFSERERKKVNIIAYGGNGETNCSRFKHDYAAALRRSLKFVRENEKAGA